MANDTDQTTYLDEMAAALRAAGVEVGSTGGEVFRQHVAKHLLAADGLVARMVADAKAEALREAARFFEYEMAPAWGGDTRWLSTGSHVADLVGDVLRERADEDRA